VLALTVPSATGQIGAIIAGDLIGRRLFPGTSGNEAAPLSVHIGRPVAFGAFGLFFALLFGLPALAAASSSHIVALISSFYRSGALVFGGDHVVLPLLQQAVVPPGWVNNDTFLAGYGAVQAVPGPLFTFAAYLGTVMGPAPNGWIGGLTCLVAIYLPSFLLLMGILPFWDVLRTRAQVQAVLRGVNASRGRTSPSRALHARMDQCHICAGRFCARGRGFPAAGAVGGAALARGHLGAIGATIVASLEVP
jgi:chromate transporter